MCEVEIAVLGNQIDNVFFPAYFSYERSIIPDEIPEKNLKKSNGEYEYKCFFMSKCPGVTLEEFIKYKKGKIYKEDFSNLCKAVEILNNKYGIYHTDLSNRKNILIKQEKETGRTFFYIIDFEDRFYLYEDDGKKKEDLDPLALQELRKDLEFENFLIEKEKSSKYKVLSTEEALYNKKSEMYFHPGK